MANFSNKTKKRMLIGGLGALCTVLVVVLTVSFSGRNPSQDTVTAASGSSSDVSIGGISSSSKSEVSVPPVSSEPNPSASSNPVLDVTKEQHVETSLTDSSGPPSEPKKPTIPDSSALTNSSKKPTYSKEQTHPNQTVSQPKAGDKKSGMIYVDGFGWVKDEGGGAAGEAVGNDGDTLTGHKVGQMD